MVTALSNSTNGTLCDVTHWLHQGVLYLQNVIRFHSTYVSAVYISQELLCNSMLIKGPARCNCMQTFIYCRVTLHVSGVTAPTIRSTKNCICYLWYKSWYWYRYFLPPWPDRALSGPIRPRWKEVAVPVPWLIPEVADTVFSTPDGGCCDTRNM